MVMTENQAQPSVNVYPNGGNGGFGGDGAWGGGLFWIIILFFFAMLTGWGNNGNNGCYNSGPNYVQQGFDQAAVMTGLNNLQATIANGFANQEVCCCNMTSQMQQAIGGVNANIADLKYTIGTEACATRQAASADTQRVMDKLCQLELDTVKSNYENRLRAQDARIADLENQVNRMDRLASQTEQTATISAGQRALANEIEQYVLPTPRPAYIVQNPNCCPQYNTCRNG